MSWSEPVNPSDPVRLVLCHPDVHRIYARVANDLRFYVVATAGTWEEAQRLLAGGDPAEAALVDGNLCEGPGPLQRLLADYGGRAVVVAPPHAAPDRLAAIRSLPCVVDVVYPDTDLGQVLDRLYRALRAGSSGGPEDGRGWPRFHGPSASPGTRMVRGVDGGVATTGWRCIAVWSLEGGSGKTTLARALAQEATARGLTVLLVGLGAPDPLPLQMGRSPEPNLLTWRAHPTPEGLRAAIQAGDGHHPDLLAGFLSPPDLGEYAPESMVGPTSLAELTAQAARAGYSVVVLDVSAQELAPPALAAANTLVLTATPTLQGALAGVEALRLARTEVGLARDACHVVLNGCRAGGMSVEAFLRAARSVAPEFPQPVAAVGDDPAVLAALNGRGSPYLRSEGLRAGVRLLADLLFAPPVAAGNGGSENRAGREVLRLGPVVFTRT